MNRPRIALGLESSRASLNVDACAELGRAFSAARQSQKRDVREVAARLLLSTAQVNGLERADAEAFYSAELYLVAARKYDALLGLSSSLVDQLLVHAVDSAAADTRPQDALSIATRVRPRLLRPIVAGSMVAVVSLTVGSWLVIKGWPLSDSADDTAAAAATALERRSSAPTMHHLVTGHHPLAPIDVRLEPPAFVPASSSPGAVLATGDGVGHIRVPRATWVFVRYHDNSVVERVIGSGETFVLRATPIYVAIGAASGAEVVLEGQRIDTSRFNVNGQLRIGSAFLSAAARHR